MSTPAVTAYVTRVLAAEYAAKDRTLPAEQWEQLTIAEQLEWHDQCILQAKTSPAYAAAIEKASDVPVAHRRFWGV